MILYNGASGGLGSYLAEPLITRGEPWHVLTSRLEDQAGLAAELAQLDPPDRVTFIHLAARVSVPACEADPDGAYLTNVTLARTTVTTVLDWAASNAVTPRVIYVSTGHVYAAPPYGSRVAEDAATGPRSVYAKTKLAAEQDLASLTSARETPLAIARVFGLIAPRQAPNYVLPGLIRRARSRTLESIPGLDFARDYLDARDVCEDLVLLASIPWPDSPLVVNVCSGRAVTIRELLAAILLAIDADVADEALGQATTAPGRPDDIKWLVGDPSRFAELTGGAPQRISLSETVASAIAGTG